MFSAQEIESQLKMFTGVFGKNYVTGCVNTEMIKNSNIIL